MHASRKRQAVAKLKSCRHATVSGPCPETRGRRGHERQRLRRRRQRVHRVGRVLWRQLHQRRVRPSHLVVRRRQRVHYRLVQQCRPLRARQRGQQDAVRPDRCVLYGHLHARQVRRRHHHGTAQRRMRRRQRGERQWLRSAIDVHWPQPNQEKSSPKKLPRSTVAQPDMAGRCPPPQHLQTCSPPQPDLPSNRANHRRQAPPALQASRHSRRY